MLISSYSIGDYKITVKKLSLGYTFTIKTKINNKLTTVGQSYIYYANLDKCIQDSYARLEEIMCVRSMFVI